VGADIDHQHPEAADDLCHWGTWVLSELGPGAAGFRFDAVKVSASTARLRVRPLTRPRQHIDSDFIARFVKHVRAETDKPKMFAVGEFWKDSLDDLNKYLDSLGTQVHTAGTRDGTRGAHARAVQHLRRAVALQLQAGRGLRRGLRPPQDLGQHGGEEPSCGCRVSS
jgi:hypothetical protein